MSFEIPHINSTPKTLSKTRFQKLPPVKTIDFSPVERFPVKVRDVSEAQDFSVLAFLDRSQSTLHITSRYNERVKLPEDCGQFFANQAANATFIDMSNCDTSQVKNMNQMFSNCCHLKFLNLREWDTSSVEDMGEMFSGCTNLKTLNISRFDTSNTANMSGMFMDCWRLNQCNLSGWNTSNVEDMTAMFASCRALQTVNLSGWDTAKTKSMKYMFAYCVHAKTFDLRQFSALAEPQIDDMFLYCNEAEMINLANFDITTYLDADSARTPFYKCESLNSLKIPTSAAEAFANMLKRDRTLSTPKQIRKIEIFDEANKASKTNTVSKLLPNLSVEQPTREL